jgi:hypothetical protein
MHRENYNFVQKHHKKEIIARPKHKYYDHVKHILEKCRVKLRTMNTSLWLGLC